MPRALQRFCDLKWRGGFVCLYGGRAVLIFFWDHPKWYWNMEGGHRRAVVVSWRRDQSFVANIEKCFYQKSRIPCLAGVMSIFIQKGIQRRPIFFMGALSNSFSMPLNSERDGGRPRIIPHFLFNLNPIFYFFGEIRDDFSKPLCFDAVHFLRKQR